MSTNMSIITAMRQLEHVMAVDRFVGKSLLWLGSYLHAMFSLLCNHKRTADMHLFISTVLAASKWLTYSPDYSCINVKLT